MSIWTILFVVLLIAWIGGFTVFHVAGGLIHLLLVFAVISLILHFVLGARTASYAQSVPLNGIEGVIGISITPFIHHRTVDSSVYRPATATGRYSPDGDSALTTFGLPCERR
jgi:hypothetical protein